MARPTKDGLDYFPKDTGFYHDPKIRALIGRFGSDGAILYDYLLCETYRRNGYYTEMDDLFVDIVAADLGMSPEKIGLILDYLLNKSMLLDGTLFKAAKVLTSHGIQTRYQEAVRGRAKKRGIDVNGELWLLNEAETESFIEMRHPQDKSGRNPDKSGRNGIKESKEKESKTNQRREERDAAAPRSPARDSRNLIFLDDVQYKDLAAELGESELTRCINYLSEYCSMHNKRYHDWPTVIRKASREQWGKRTTKGETRPGYAPGTTNFQPSAERIRKNNEWLDKFLAEQREKEGEQT